MINPETARYLKWIRAGLKAGRTQTGLAEALGVAHPQVSALLSGKRLLKVNEVPVIAKYLGIPPPARQFPLVGTVGAGGAVNAQAPGEHADMVSGPEDAPFETVAVDIDGDSLGPMFHGWRAFYADRRDPFAEEWIGKLCVVGTDDDRVLIKWVRRGADGFTLQSGTGGLEEGVTIVWAARVIDIRDPR